MGYKIQIIEDETETAEGLKLYLENKNYNVIISKTGKSGIANSKKFLPDLVLLDVMLPDGMGFDIINQLEFNNDKNVIFISALGNKENVMRGFNAGANDYITKPFDLDILDAKINVHIKDKGNKYEIKKGIKFDSIHSSINIDNKVCQITRTEYKILYCLAKSQGYVTKQDLCEYVYNNQVLDSDVMSIRVHIAGLRKRLNGLSSRYKIKTKYAKGYKLERDEYEK